MGWLSKWAVRRPVVALISWFIFLIAIIGIGGVFKGTLNDSFSLPNTDSTQAQALLEELPASGAQSATAQIVWSMPGTSVKDPAVATPVVALLTTLSKNPAVACITNPYDPKGGSLGSACKPVEPFDPSKLTPEQKAAAAATVAAISPFSPNDQVAYSTLTFVGPADGSGVKTADAQAIIATVKAANSGGLEVGANGQILEFAGTEPPSSELIGIIVAFIILLLAFGSLIAAGMPILVAIMGLVGGQMLVLLVARFLDVATFAPTLAAMIGLGVGIDYSLFILNRFRQAVQAGHDPKAAALEAVGTAGRAVQFAAFTVIVALLGLFVMGISFFNGLAIASGVTVLMVMLSALWLLPALLSLLGAKSLGIRMPWARKSKEFHPEGGGLARYGRWLQRRPIVPALAALIVVVLLALPTLSLRLGFADASGKPAGSPSRVAYDLMASGFGPGSNGPFYVAIELPAGLDQAAKISALETTLNDLGATPNVAKTMPSADMVPFIVLNPNAFNSTGTVTSAMVTPMTGPQDEATRELLGALRGQTAATITANTGAKIYVGGTQAITEDFTSVLVKALPIFLLVVIGLGFLGLTVLFRSLVVPLTAAITSLLSFGAALGVTVAIFQWGWFASLLGLSGTGPIMPFLPVMVFAILFGLSMDYQVFLVSRMQEEWVRTKDNSLSVRRGLAGSGRVVMIAAAIMASVFLAFVPAIDSTIKLFGVSLASAVIVDAFIVRMVLVPSVMSILGKHNWYLPRWLDRILPKLDIEGGADEITDDQPAPAVGQ